MPTEPITLHLRANSALSGSGLIPLRRNDLTASAGGRFQIATIPSGSRIASDMFGLFTSDGVKALTIAASTHCPADVARVYFGAALRTEIDLQGEAQSVLLGPGEELAFVTADATTISITANELSEAEQAALFSTPRSFLTRVRLLKTDGSGFSPSGVMSPALRWSETTRLFSATAVGSGSVPLRTLHPRESRYQGVSVRVRVTGFDGSTASVGVTDATNGDTHFVASVVNGEWSPRFLISHDDLIGIESPQRRPGLSAVAADIELVPTTATDSVCCPSEPTTSDDVSQAPGTIVEPHEWSDYSVNAAGSTQSHEGWSLFTRAVTNPVGGFNGPGTGNKAVLGTDILLGQPLGLLQSLVIRYACRSAAISSFVNHPYVQFMVDVNGDGSLFRVLQIDRSATPQLNLLQQASVGTAPQDHEYTVTWVGAGKVKVVGGAPGVTPIVNLGAGWQNKVYAIPDLLAQFPNARFGHGFVNNPDLPNNLAMPSMWIVIGDPSYTENSRSIIRRVRLNG